VRAPLRWLTSRPIALWWRPHRSPWLVETFSIWRHCQPGMGHPCWFADCPTHVSINYHRHQWKSMVVRSNSYYYIYGLCALYASPDHCCSWMPLFQSAVTHHGRLDRPHLESVPTLHYRHYLRGVTSVSEFVHMLPRIVQCVHHEIIMLKKFYNRIVRA
jgi:hypothetical protein